MSFLESLLVPLRQQGFRITRARRCILECLSDRRCALTVSDVQQLLKQRGIAFNPSTAYRELQFLVQQGIVQEVFLKDMRQRFELNSQSHHHHLVCTFCDQVEPFTMDRDLHDWEEKIQRKKNFRILSHHLEFYGACRKCR